MYNFKIFLLLLGLVGLLMLFAVTYDNGSGPAVSSGALTINEHDNTENSIVETVPVSSVVIDKHQKSSKALNMLNKAEAGSDELVPAEDAAATAPKTNLVDLWQKQEATYPQYAKTVIASHDSNGDGYLTADEFGSPEAFANIDRNGDGLLAEDEIISRVRVSNSEKLSGLIKMKERAEELLSSLDKNGDGEIARYELSAGMDIALFSELDTNGDGVVSSEELRDVKNAFSYDHEIEYLKQQIGNGYD